MSARSGKPSKHFTSFDNPIIVLQGVLTGLVPSTQSMVTAAINAYAMAGDVKCALACDGRIAEEHAQMALPQGVGRSAGRRLRHPNPALAGHVAIDVPQARATSPLGSNLANRNLRVPWRYFTTGNQMAVGWRFERRIVMSALR